MRALERSLKERDVPYRTDVSAKELCTFRIGGTVALVIEPRCERELCEAISLGRSGEYPVEILGNGSNVLFEDDYLSLAVIRTAALNCIRVLRDGGRAGSGASLARICTVAATHGFAGAQALCGIPATLGGALAMNAGAHGKQLSDIVKCVKTVDVFTGEIETDFNFKKNALYRYCGLQYKNKAFLSAELALEHDGDPQEILAEMQRMKMLRRSTQPLELPSAGCVFKRPCRELPIGKFLDELGCKGMRVGGAEVSQKHAAFIVNRGGASAADVKTLIQEIQKKAEKERGMIPECEIRIISNKA